MPSPDTLVRLSAAISAAAPIVGVSIGSWSDKTTWRIDYAGVPTPAQVTAAQAAITAFSVAANDVPMRVRMWQLKAQLQINNQLTLANTAITTAASAVQTNYWNQSDVMDVGSATFATISASLALTPAQVLTLFTNAAALTA